MASTLRGCLLESLAWLRPNDEASALIANVVGADGGPEHSLEEALSDYLETRRVASCHLPDNDFVAIHSPRTLSALDRSLNVQPLLNSTRGRNALGDPGNPRRPHLDQAAVLLASTFGRRVTQHCSLSLWDPDPPIGGIAYRSRHDLTEWCWAAYDRTPVEFAADVVSLSPEVEDHREALEAVADLWELPLDEWLEAH